MVVKTRKKYFGNKNQMCSTTATPSFDTQNNRNHKQSAMSQPISQFKASAFYSLLKKLWLLKLDKKYIGNKYIQLQHHLDLSHNAMEINQP